MPDRYRLVFCLIAPVPAYSVRIPGNSPVAGTAAVPGHSLSLPSTLPLKHSCLAQKDPTLRNSGSDLLRATWLIFTSRVTSSANRATLDLNGCQFGWELHYVSRSGNR